MSRRSQGRFIKSFSAALQQYFIRCLTKNCSAVIEIELSRPVCVELYQDCKELGRFMLRYGGNTIAAGLIIKVM